MPCWMISLIWLPRAQAQATTSAGHGIHGTEANDANDEQLLLAIGNVYQMISSTEETQRKDEAEKKVQMASIA